MGIRLSRLTYYKDDAFIMNQEEAKHRYEVLAEKWLKGTITPEEAREYTDWYNTSQDAPVDIPASFAASEAAHEQRMLRQMEERIGMHTPIVPLVQKYRRLWWGAAALLVLAAGSYFWLQQQAAPAAAPGNDEIALQYDVPPGTNKAVLTLSNGRQIILDSAANGTLALQGNASIVKQDDGSLSYLDTPGNNTHEVLYNTMSIPKGGQYQLTLPDGSRVWLNAASTLKYPTSFTGKERSVELTGEGYFEIAPDAHQPFLVKAGSLQVKVLGTSFNVMAYADEKSINTTLLSGAVKVLQGTQEKTLTPGQQATVDNQTGLVTINETEAEQAIAWKDGMFRFSSSNMAMVLRQVSRWYDIEVVYQGKVPQGHITGKVPRSMKLSRVLRVLELSGVHCKLEKNKLIILP